MSINVNNHSHVSQSTALERSRQPTEQGQLQQQLVAMMVHVIMQQIMEALAREKNGPSKTEDNQGPQKAEGVGKAKDNKNGQGTEAILQQFFELLKLLGDMSGKGQGCQANGLAQKVADGLSPGNNQDTLDNVGKDTGGSGGLQQDFASEFAKQLIESVLPGKTDAASGMKPSKAEGTGGPQDLMQAIVSEIAKQLVDALGQLGEKGGDAGVGKAGGGGLSQQQVGDILQQLIKALQTGDMGELDKQGGEGGNGGGGGDVAQSSIGDIAQRLMQALTSGGVGKQEGATAAKDAGGKGTPGLSQDGIKEMVQQLVEALLTGDTSKLGKTAGAEGNDKKAEGASGGASDFLQQLIEALLAKHGKTDEAGGKRDTGNAASNPSSPAPTPGGNGASPSTNASPSPSPSASGPSASPSPSVNYANPSPSPVGPKPVDGPGATGSANNDAETAPLKGGKLPPLNGEKTVNETIVVKAGETFDGKGMHFKAGPALGDGGQSEGQKPIFVLEPGAKIKNVQLSGADGIHAKGDATLNNVVWRDVGEDAFTLKGPGKVEVNGGGAFNANDKIFQLNAGGSLKMNNFTADTFGKAIRTNGGKEFDIDISVTNSTFTNGKEAVVRTDASQARINMENNKLDNTLYDVIAPKAAQVEGATQRGWKEHTG